MQYFELIGFLIVFAIIVIVIIKSEQKITSNNESPEDPRR